MTVAAMMTMLMMMMTTTTMTTTMKEELRTKTPWFWRESCMKAQQLQGKRREQQRAW